MTPVSSSTARTAQIELFGLVAAGNGLMTLSEPCRQCAHGHFQKWLPKPGGVR